MSQGPGLDGGLQTPAQVDTCSFFHAGVLLRGAAPSQPLGPERPGPAPAAAPAQPAPGVTPSPVSALASPVGFPDRVALPAPAATSRVSAAGPSGRLGPRQPCQPRRSPWAQVSPAGPSSCFQPQISPAGPSGHSQLSPTSHVGH